MSYDFQNDSFWSSLHVNNTNTNYNIAGGNIVNHNVNNNYIVPQNVKSDIAKVENTLKQHHVPGAVVEAQPEDAGCMPGTRVKLLGDVLVLLKSHALPHIVWIAGMAGTGKTAIANTLCSMIWMDPMVHLGGTFFCSRSAGSVERTDVKRIIPTLAILLARQFPAFACSLAKQLSETPDVAHWSVRSQVDRLIMQPLNELAHDTYTGQMVFVIDALDECDNHSLLGELINSIADFKCKLPVRFLLTSRPEMHIRTTPISDPVLSSILRLHTVNPEQVTADIRLCISTKLAQASKTANWYSVHDVEALVTLSGGLFIFASTILKYIINRGDNAGRRERLRKATTAITHSAVAMNPLDRMYELVITEASRSDQVDTDELGSMRKILACVLTARASLSVQALADLVGSSADTLRGSLERLHSLVHLPGENTEPGLRTLHASFGDYMLGRAADHIRLTPSLGHDLLADGCLRRMDWFDLRFNISRSRSSYEPNAVFQQDSISFSLIYACSHWAHHIDAASTRSAFDEIIGTTFRRKFLFWLEVLSITGKMGLASGLLRIASSAVKSQEVAQFLRDANSFVASSHAAIARSAPHIYLSAVPFASKDSLVFLDFARLCAGVISVETFGTDHHASRLVMTLAGFEGRVKSVAYSLSGDLLAAGLENGTVHVWDTRTGEEVVSPMRSGDSAISSIAFAPDGQRLASGTANGNMSVWNVATGRLLMQQSLARYSAIDLLAFSPDGKRVASYSWSNAGLWNVETDQTVSAESDDKDLISLSFLPDGTVLTLRSWGYERRWHLGSLGTEFQLLPYPEDSTYDNSSSLHSSKLSIAWDDISGLISVTRAGRVVTLPTPSDMIDKIHISPEETCIVASGIGYNGLQLWDLRCIDADPTFTVLGRHPDSVSASSFSSDGKYLASESLNCTIQIWDVGSSKDTFQRVQESNVTALAVSPGGSFVACGSEDGSVHVHDVRTGEVKLRPLIGCRTQMQFVSISPDGQILAAGSEDKTVRLWHVQTGTPIGEGLRGHRSTVLAVAFSPDAHWLASGSRDGTVLAWDVATGDTMEFAPMKCQNCVKSVTFSSNGQALAAVDFEGHMYFWHLETGQLVHLFQLDGLHSQDFSPGASRLLAFDKERDGFIYIVDVITGERLHSVQAPELYFKTVQVVWSPCKRYVAMMSRREEVCLWDLAHHTVSKLQGFELNSAYWSPLAFASDGRFLVSGARDGLIRLWDVEDACSLALRAGDDPVVRLASAKLKDGWLIGPSGELLLWVPTDYQEHLQFAPHTWKIFGPRRIVITVGDRGLNWGEEWHACWRGAVL